MSKAFDSVKIKNAFAKFKEKADQTYNEKLVDGQTIKTINNQSILGSGNLDVKGVTEIATEYIRITDLDTGIYKLTWGGANNVAVKLYYNGATSTTTVTLNANFKYTQPILYVTKLVYGTYKWDWYVLGEYSNYDLTVYFGSTTSSNGSYSTKRLDQLLDNNNIISSLAYNSISSTAIPNYTVLQQFLATGYNDTTTRTDGENISGTALRGFMAAKLPVTINDIKYTYQRTDTGNSSIIYSAIANYYPDEITHTIYTARLDYTSNILYLAKETIKNVHTLHLNISNGIPNTNFSYSAMPPQIMIFDVASDVLTLSVDIKNLINLTIMFRISFQTPILGLISSITFLGAWQGYTLEVDNDPVPFADLGELEVLGLKYQVFVWGTNLYLVNKNIYIPVAGNKLPNIETIPVNGWYFIHPFAGNTTDFITVKTLISSLNLALGNGYGDTYTLDLTPNEKAIKKLPIVSLDEDVDRVVSYSYTIGDTELVADSGIYDFTTTVKIEQPMPQRLSIAQNLVVNINGEQFDLIGVNGGWYPLSKWSDPITSGNYIYRTLQHREYDETSQQFTQYTTANLGKAKELLSFITGSEYFEIYNPNKPMPCFVFVTETKTWWKLQWENTSLRAYRVDNLPFAIKPSNETFTITSSAWVSDGNIAPFDYKTTITVTTTIGANTIVELVNNNAVAFATYGFSIGDVTNQVVTIYSIGQPSANIDFLIKVGD